MNQRPTGLHVTKALTGFLQYKSAEGLSPVTVSGYEHDLKLWIEYQGDMDVAAVETTHILAYLNYLRTDYVPRRITSNNDKKLSPKTVYNLYISVASFFTWASREFQIHNPVKGVPRPRVPEDPPVEPFKKEEIELLIKACDFCEEAVTDRRRKFIMQRSIADMVRRFYEAKAIALQQNVELIFVILTKLWLLNKIQELALFSIPGHVSLVMEYSGNPGCLAKPIFGGLNSLISRYGYPKIVDLSKILKNDPNYFLPKIRSEVLDAICSRPVSISNFESS